MRPALRAIPTAGISYVGVELSPSMIRRARARATSRGLSSFRFVEADAAELPLDSVSVDLFFSFWGLHCLAAPGRQSPKSHEYSNRADAVFGELDYFGVSVASSGPAVNVGRLCPPSIGVAVVEDADREIGCSWHSSLRGGFRPQRGSGAQGHAARCPPEPGGCLERAALPCVGKKPRR